MRERSGKWDNGRKCRAISGLGGEVPRFTLPRVWRSQSAGALCFEVPGSLHYLWLPWAWQRTPAADKNQNSFPCASSPLPYFLGFVINGLFFPTLLRLWLTGLVYPCISLISISSQFSHHVIYALACLLSWVIMKDWNLCKCHAQVEGIFGGIPSCIFLKPPELSCWVIGNITDSQTNSRFPTVGHTQPKGPGTVIQVWNSQWVGDQTIKL